MHLHVLPFKREWIKVTFVTCIARHTLARKDVSIETVTLLFQLLLQSLTYFRVVHVLFYLSRERFYSQVMFIVIRRSLDLQRDGLRALFPLTCTLIWSIWLQSDAHVVHVRRNRPIRLELTSLAMSIRTWMSFFPSWPQNRTLEHVVLQANEIRC